MYGIVNAVKDFFYSIYAAGYLVIGYIVIMSLVFVSLMLFDYFGYSGKVLRGSKSTLKFYKERGWVDNSNVSTFIIRCIRKFPYLIRARFNLYTRSDKRLEEYVDDKIYIDREFRARQELLRYVYDFLLIVVSALTLIYMILVERTLLVPYFYALLIIFVLRYIFIGSVILRELRAKKVFIKALDLMYNGIFLPKKSKTNDTTSPELDLAYDSNIDKDIIDRAIDSTRADVVLDAEDDSLQLDEEDNKKIDMTNAAVDKTH